MQLAHTIDEALTRFQLVGGAGDGESTACAMSLLNWIWRNGEGGWSDAPECAHPLISSAVIRANDDSATTPEDRAELVRLGQDGALDTWWVPVEVIAWALSGPRDEEPPSSLERAKTLLSKIAAWKQDRQKPDLRGANLGGANLRDANLGDAYLRGANLRDAYLRDAYLGGAYLGGANLGGANLRDANLGDAYLRGANLRGANLRDANLGGANLGGANLRGANLWGANLWGANLGGATYTQGTLWPAGFDPQAAGAVKG